MLFCHCCVLHLASTVNGRMLLKSVGERHGVLTSLPVVPLVLPTQSAKLKQGHGAVMGLFVYAQHQAVH